MHGREVGETRKRMWPVPLSKAGTVAVDVSNGGRSSPDNSFVKDGRKISVGDCALFKPAQDSPPFIGIIHCSTSSKSSNSRLSVNWLYRPAEVELEEGVTPEAAPNEVFYSFHSDEIPAASLIHPCKVAFLPRGVELPPGVSSFVCRRVYDITNKRLWWLTDQDFIDERQKEVNKLLQKTRIEMHSSAQQQQGARSPKPVNGSAATSPLKHSPDSIQNSSSNLSSQTKGKKRERGDHSSEPIKRERSVRIDDGDSGQLRSDSMFKLEVAKIAEKGGLVDSEAVERLVQLMQPDKSDRKIDLAGRSMLAGIIAATDKVDCLGQFVQLKGLAVLDEWLQEVHKGKIRDAGNFKDGDKSVEDFLLVLLRALDKIPVNLNALQMCNIGKSVNHLRTHKNSEIQKKARTLVDMWKKRVEAEMNINDAKSGSSQAVAWPGRSRHDGSLGGNRHSSGSSDAAVRSSVTHHSSLKASSVKLVQGDSTSKSVSVYPGGARSALSPTSAAVNCKDGQSRISVNAASSETPQAVVREEKSSSSSQSHTDSQCSNDHVKTIVPSGKEDARSSTAGSRSSNKITGSGSKHRKSANGLQGAATSGLQRETAPNRGTSMARISTVEKVSDNVNAIDASAQEGNNHKLIVKIPNRGRGAVQSITGGSLEDSSCRNSRASSPALSEKHDQTEASLREKPDPCQSSEVDGASTSAHHKTSNEARRLQNVTKVAYSPSRNEMKPRKVLDSSFSSMNALVESCVKFSEANASMSAGDDVGMNLLASVAAREISHSGTGSPAVSPHRNSAAAEISCSNHNSNQNQVNGGDFIQKQYQSTKIADADKHNIVAGVSRVNDGETFKQCGSSSNQNEEGCLKSNGKLEHGGVASLPISPGTTGKTLGDEGADALNGKSATVKDESQNHLAVSSQGLVLSLAAEDKVKDACLNEESEKRAPRDTLLAPSSNVNRKHDVIHCLPNSYSLEQHSQAMALQSESMKDDKMTIVSSSPGQELAAENTSEVKSEKTDGKDLCNHDVLEENRRLDQENDPSAIPKKQEECGLSSVDKERNTSCKDENVDNKETLVHQSGTSATQVSSSVVAPQQTEVCSSPKVSDMTAAEVDRKEDSGCVGGKAAGSPATGGLDIDRKLGFDLNEGLSMDEGKIGEPIHSGSSPCPASVSSVSPLQFPVSSASGGLPASITVAAAAKGPFLPPDDLLKNKRELGWKGSAATSAFRPAEPRKAMEVPQGPSKFPLTNAPSSKQSRPFLDIDLNVADERILLDLGCQTSGQESTSKDNAIRDISSGGLDLDLNKADEVPDVVQHSASNTQRLDLSTPLVKASRSSIFSNGEASGGRDFDLNDGPATDEMPVEQTSYSRSQHGRNNVPPQVPFGPRINSSDTGNCFAWYPPGTSYSVSMTPAVLHDRESFPIVGLGSGPQRVMGGPTSNLSFNPDAYRGSVLSSTPAMPFHSTPFQYPVFPFGTSFPLPGSALSGGSSGFMDPTAGGRISAIPSQLVGTAAAVPFQYPHAYVVSRPIADLGNNGVVESNQKWGKQGLDLNSGPGGVDPEGRDESVPTVSRPFTAIGSQSHVEEQARMLNMAGGGVLKRKEPEGGWTMDKLNFKQSSWR